MECWRYDLEAFVKAYWKQLLIVACLLFWSYIRSGCTEYTAVANYDAGYVQAEETAKSKTKFVNYYRTGEANEREAQRRIDRGRAMIALVLPLALAGLRSSSVAIREQLRRYNANCRRFVSRRHRVLTPPTCSANLSRRNRQLAEYMTGSRSRKSLLRKQYDTLTRWHGISWVLVQ